MDESYDDDKYDSKDTYDGDDKDNLSYWQRQW